MTDDSLTSNYDAVAAADVADFLHHLANLRLGEPHADDPHERVAFLARKSELFNRIAQQYTRTDPGYAEQVRQMAIDARAAADHAALQPQRQRVGPKQRRTRHGQPTPGGARSKQKTGASSD